MNLSLNVIIGFTRFASSKHIQTDARLWKNIPSHNDRKKRNWPSKKQIGAEAGTGTFPVSWSQDDDDDNDDSIYYK